MPQKRRKFQRSLGELPYKKLFVLAVEGVKTEPQYFGIFNNQQSVIRVSCLKSSRGSSPLHVLKRMEDHLRQEELRSTDEAWLVVDKDQWTDEQLVQLHEWATSQDNFGFALSNPKFEYWLCPHSSGTPSVSFCYDSSTAEFLRSSRMQPAWMAAQNGLSSGGLLHRLQSPHSRR